MEENVDRIITSIGLSVIDSVAAMSLGVMFMECAC